MTEPPFRVPPGFPVAPVQPVDLGFVETMGTDKDHPQDADDWLKGAGAWPFPQATNPDDLRALLLDNGESLQGFRASLLYRRWVDRLPWLAKV